MPGSQAVWLTCHQVDPSQQRAGQRGCRLRRLEMLDQRRQEHAEGEGHAVHENVQAQ